MESQLIKINHDSNIAEIDGLPVTIAVAHSMARQNKIVSESSSSNPYVTIIRIEKV